MTVRIVLVLASIAAMTAGCDVANPGAHAAANSAATPEGSVPATATPVVVAPAAPPAVLTGATLQRHQDLLKVKAALERYAADHNGAYPVAEKYEGYVSAWGPSLGEKWIPELVPEYIDALPRDPANAKTADGQIYIYRSDGKDYKLLAHGYGDCSPAIEQEGIKIDPVRTKDGKCWAYGVWTLKGAMF
jgi:hypothetical protein